MPTYEILRAADAGKPEAEREVQATLDAASPAEALNSFRDLRSYDGEVEGTPTRASLAVVGVGLFLARRRRSTDEQVADADRRAGAAERVGDEATASAWRREGDRRALADRPVPFEPLASEHPLVGETCKACRQPFEAGQVTTLVPLGPGDDPDARAKAREGRPYNAIAVPVHYACATGEEG